MSVKKWLYEDNELREAPYRKDLAEENFLASFNLNCEKFEAEFPVPEFEPHPIILFYGLPRCGKTFFSQAMRYCLDLGVVSNLAARFWLAPATGLRLSRITGVDGSDSSFASDYGKTAGLSDPHDFAYFWHHWLVINDWPYDADAASGQIDWDGLGYTLRRMSAEWGRPGLMKGVLPSFHMSRFHNAYRKVFFVELQRDLADVAYSLLRGRRENFGDENAVYGQVRQPTDVARYRELSAHESVASQIRDLLALYEHERRGIHQQMHMTVSYNELCKRPMAVVRRIACAVEEAFGSNILIRQELPDDSFKSSRHSAKNPDMRALTQALEKLGLAARD